MVESNKISGTLLPPVAATPQGYRDSREITLRANVSERRETPGNVKSLSRLHQALDSQRPLRNDVPRGYYLDIVV